MAAPRHTDQLFPLRAWRGFSESCSSSYRSAAMICAACRAFTSDLITPASDQEQVMAEHARTFRFATRFLPGDYRRATISLYAFFRSLDDLVDESPDDVETIAAIRVELDDWERWFSSGCAGPAPREAIGETLVPVITEYQIPVQLFYDFLDGLRADLAPVTPQTRGDVEHYSYQVASTVGIAMAYVFGSTSPVAIDAARRLGIAMQLTNILRDVGGDAARNRVYLPLGLLREHGLSAEHVFEQWESRQGPDGNLVIVLRTMVNWADSHYAAGIAGIRTLPRDVQMPILVAARLYQRILRELESNQYDSLRQRAATGGRMKLTEAGRCMVTIHRCLDEAETTHARLDRQHEANARPTGSGTHAR